MKANFHTHSVYSDGADTLTELVEAAIENGFGALGFSEHSYTYFDESYCMSRENTLRYISEVRALQEKYRGRIALYLGIEQDFYSTESVDNYEYVIGSVHYLKKGGHFLPVDESTEDLARFRDMYYEGDIYALIEDYFAAVGAWAEKKCDIIGHFDLITKFNEKQPLFDTEHPRYKMAAQKALDKILAADKTIEINTGAMARAWRSSPYPDAKWLDYIVKKDGRLILASDCHDKKDLDFAFDTLAPYREYLSIKPFKTL